MVKRMEIIEKIIKWQCEVCRSVYFNEDTAISCEYNCSNIEKGR